MVTYAVDDAVDLAAVFAKRMKDKTKIAIAISGQPRKASSKIALQKLQQEGAKVVDATKENVERLLVEQAGIAGSGELFVSFATHGFTQEGVPYLLATTSSFEDPSSAISAEKVLDIAAHAARSFIVLDACRERISSARAPRHRVSTGAPSIRILGKYAGQVVFAPAAGKNTDDDFEEQNGVFTGAILAGLRGAICDRSGYVTVDELHHYVERRMMRWLKKRYPGMKPPAIQVNIDGETASMPLARCSAGPPIGSVVPNACAFDVFDPAGTHLWGKRFEDAVIDATFSEPDNLVIALTAHHLRAYDSTGVELWTAELGKGLFPEKLKIEKLIRGAKQSQIVVLASGGGGSTVAMWDADSTPRGAYRSPQPLREIQIVRMTSRHGWKLVARTKNALLMLEPKSLETPLWQGKLHPPERTIRKLWTDDQNHDEKLDLAITLASGETLYVDFEGRRMPGGDADDTRFEHTH